MDLLGERGSGARRELGDDPLVELTGLETGDQEALVEPERWCAGRAGIYGLGFRRVDRQPSLAALHGSKGGRAVATRIVDQRRHYGWVVDRLSVDEVGSEERSMELFERRALLDADVLGNLESETRARHPIGRAERQFDLVALTRDPLVHGRGTAAWSHEPAFKRDVGMKLVGADRDLDAETLDETEAVGAGVRPWADVVAPQHRLHGCRG